MEINDLVGWNGKVDVLDPQGRRYPNPTTLERAKRFVSEGLASVKGKTMIQVIVDTRDFRKFILDRDHHTCFYCNDHATTIDHLIPVSKGGLDTPDNCVACCLKCNQLKGTRTLEEFQHDFPKDVATKVWDAVDFLKSKGLIVKVRMGDCERELGK